MSARAWEAILATWDGANKEINKEINEKKLPSEDPRLEARLVKLSESLSTQLLGQLIQRLQSILTQEALEQPGPSADGGDVPRRSPADEVHDVIAPLAIHLDERVLQRLSPKLVSSWTRLQDDVIGSDDGGAKFYENLEALLGSSSPSLLVLEVYLFCLCEGFLGSCVDTPEKIPVYKDRIMKRLPAPLAAKENDAVQVQPPKASWWKNLPAPAYYAAAAVAALLVILLLRALAR